MLCTGAAVAAIAAVYGIGANGESPNNMTTAPTITTTKGAFSDLTRRPHLQRLRGAKSTAPSRDSGARAGRQTRRLNYRSQLRLCSAPLQ